MYHGCHEGESRETDAHTELLYYRQHTGETDTRNGKHKGTRTLKKNNNKKKNLENTQYKQTVNKPSNNKCENHKHNLTRCNTPSTEEKKKGT